MITGTKTTKGRVEYSFDLPLDARELADAYYQVDKEQGDSGNDDRFFVKSDGESLIFYWEVK